MKIFSSKILVASQWLQLSAPGCKKSYFSRVRIKIKIENKKFRQNRFFQFSNKKRKLWTILYSFIPMNSFWEKMVHFWCFFKNFVKMWTFRFTCPCFVWSSEQSGTTFDILLIQVLILSRRLRSTSLCCCRLWWSFLITISISIFLFLNFKT